MTIFEEVPRLPSNPKRAAIFRTPAKTVWLTVKSTIPDTPKPELEVSPACCCTVFRLTLKSDTLGVAARRGPDVLFTAAGAWRGRLSPRERGCHG